MFILSDRCWERCHDSGKHHAQAKLVFRTLWKSIDIYIENHRVSMSAVTAELSKNTGSKTSWKNEAQPLTHFVFISDMLCCAILSSRPELSNAFIAASRSDWFLWRTISYLSTGFRPLFCTVIEIVWRAICVVKSITLLTLECVISVSPTSAPAMHETKRTTNTCHTIAVCVGARPVLHLYRCPEPQSLAPAAGVSQQKIEKHFHHDH